MWEGYLTAVEEFIAAHDEVTARLVIDRFHVAQQYRDDFDDLPPGSIDFIKRPYYRWIRNCSIKLKNKKLPAIIYKQSLIW